ncbi:MAG: glycosyltransferase [Candidatus Omnitrophica bacterium]|nr:glycosyltransferase [Candidatus Omnitrophota bacterium]
MWIRNGKNSWEYRDSPRLIFTGAIYNPGNLQTLLQLSQAIGKLNRKGVNLKLDIYTTADNLALYKEMFTSEKDTEFLLLFPDQEKMAKLYGGADILLLVLGFGKVDSIGEKYSMPTKLPAYMLSGTPIMACAPAGSALAKFIKNKNVGFLISKVGNIDELAEDINRICHDQAVCKEVGINARAVALREFSAEVVRPRFEEALLSIR